MRLRSKRKDWADLPPPSLYFNISRFAPNVKKGRDTIENGKKSKYAAQERYDAENVRRILIKLNKKTDKDILSVLDMTKPLATQIKQLIRKGITK